MLGTFRKPIIKKDLWLPSTNLNLTLAKVVADFVIDNLTKFFLFGLKKGRLVIVNLIL